jgi:trehalose 6-phosphate phosphatase
VSERYLRELLDMAPSDVLIVTDYDGTIAPIVSDPARAVPVPGSAEHLASLATLARGVAVLSGRSEESLRAFLPIPGVALIGENGIEALTGDERAHLRELRARATAAVERWPGVVVEAKPASLSVHFRSQPEVAAELEQILAKLIAGSGLMMVANRMVFDIQSRRGSKVRTMCRLMREMKPAAVLYAGDSRDDAHVHRCLTTARVARLCIEIMSDEVPAGLFKNADLVLDGPEEMASFLGRLVRRWSARPSGPPPIPETVAR